MISFFVVFFVRWSGLSGYVQGLSIMLHIISGFFALRKCKIRVVVTCVYYLRDVAMRRRRYVF